VSLRGSGKPKVSGTRRWTLLILLPLASLILFVIWAIVSAPGSPTLTDQPFGIGWLPPELVGEWRAGDVDASQTLRLGANGALDLSSADIGIIGTGPHLWSCSDIEIQSEAGGTVKTVSAILRFYDQDSGSSTTVPVVVEITPAARTMRWDLPREMPRGGTMYFIDAPSEWHA